MNKVFPDGFKWGVATSCYQIEGAHNLDGKGPSIWDAFCQIPGKVYEDHHANIACDHYNRLEEDVQLMKNLGVDTYRFSIAWTRILPSGKGAVNQAGIDFYNRLIDLLLAAGIEPWVTLYHWDLPLNLQLEEDGWLNPVIADRFADYARVCYQHFGDRVKHWITLNEPWVVAMLGHGQGVFAPGRTSNVEPYTAGHNLILAHAKSVKVYREEFQSSQKGIIGITNNCDWREPLSDSAADILAAERALEFFLAWFTDPIYKGDYPSCMRERLGDRLPEFTSAEKEMIKGSTDFFGLNHYTTMYASDATNGVVESGVYGNGGLSEDQDVNLSVDPTWKKTTMGWAVVPWGLKKLLLWISDRYDHPDIYITENGCSYDDEVVDGKIMDSDRLDFYKTYLESGYDAIAEGAKLKGYFAWSLMDNFEWASGYTKRFGIHYVDYETLVRTPKESALWLKKVFASNSINDQ